MSAVEKYIHGIRNTAKQSYARQYAMWLQNGGTEPTRGELGVMAAQAVRMNIRQLRSEDAEAASQVQKSVIEMHAESQAQVVATLSHRDGTKRPVTRGELSAAFDAVAPKDNWKMPIDATVNLDPFLKDMVSEAIVFFTGSVASFEALTGSTTSGITKYRVTAAGYYRAIGP